MIYALDAVCNPQTFLLSITSEFNILWFKLNRIVVHLYLPISHQSVNGILNIIGEIADIPLVRAKAKDEVKNLRTCYFLVNSLNIFDNIEAAKAKPGIELTCYCRAYLVSCTRMVLKCYCSMTHPLVLQGVSDSLIISSKQVDIIGYWEEKWLAGTVFWQIEDAGQNTYFLYRWQFNSSEHRAIYTRYSVILVNGNTECMMIAPWYIALKVEDRLPNKPYIAIYDVEIDDEHRPTAISFMPTFRSEDFPSTLSLSRVENTENIQRLDKVVREYDVTDNFADMHYLYRL